MLAGHWLLQYKKREGYHLLAPSTYWYASEEVILSKTGGCGPGKFGDLLVPDNLLGESIFLACQIHDWMFREVINEKTQRIANKVFMWNMLEIIDDGEVLDHIRLKFVMNYYEAVSFYGGSFVGGRDGKS